jgi:hypothetical protein
MHTPSPPIVTSAVTGFVAGVLVTLAATGVVAHSGNSSAASPLPTTRPVRSSTLHDRLWRMATHALGPYTSEKQKRLISVSLLNVHSLEAVADPLSDLGGFKSATIYFRLNDHPLGKPWRLRAAKADVFAVMKSIYTSDLPVYDTELIGVFPLPTKKGKIVSRAVIAYETHDAAGKIPWKNWGRENESVLWNRLPYHWVDPRFG